MAADIGDSRGVNRLANAGRGERQLTLGDTGLDATAARWASMTSSRRLARGSQNDNALERLQRDSGGYPPGQMRVFQDQLNKGTDNTT